VFDIFFVNLFLVKVYYHEAVGTIVMSLFLISIVVEVKMICLMKYISVMSFAIMNS
jgi:hypothetical protein